MKKTFKERRGEHRADILGDDDIRPLARRFPDGGEPLDDDAEFVLGALARNAALLHRSNATPSRPAARTALPVRKISDIPDLPPPGDPGIPSGGPPSPPSGGGGGTPAPGGGVTVGPPPSRGGGTAPGGGVTIGPPGTPGAPVHAVLHIDPTTGMWVDANGNDAGLPKPVNPNAPLTVDPKTGQWMDAQGNVASPTGKAPTAAPASTTPGAPGSTPPVTGQPGTQAQQTTVVQALANGSTPQQAIAAAMAAGMSLSDATSLVNSLASQFPSQAQSPPPDSGSGYGGGGYGGGGGGGGGGYSGGGGGGDGPPGTGGYTAADAAFDAAQDAAQDDDGSSQPDPGADPFADTGDSGGSGTSRLSYTADQGDQGDDVMGDELLDDDRLIIRNNHQITDDSPFAERTPASSHRGADYLQQYEIPPGLRQAGTEGGYVVPEDKISVFGAAKKAVQSVFSDYWKGLDVVGAAIAHPPKNPPRAGFVAKPSTRPGVRPMPSLFLNKPKHGNDKASIANARTAGKRAVSVGEKLLKTLATTKVKGEAFGAGPHAQVKGALAAVQVKQLANRAIKAGKDTLSHADKHEKLVATNTTRVKTGAQHGKQLTHIRGTGGGDSILGADDMAVYGAPELALLDHLSADESLSAVQVLGAFQRILGLDATSDAASNIHVFGDATNPPDPNNPGFLVDGSPDPAAGTSSDASSGMGSPPTSAPPLQAGVDYAPDPGPATDTNFYSSDPAVPGVALPDGAVLYDGTQRIPFAGVASMSRILGQVPGLDAPEGGNGSGFELHDDGWYWWWSQAYTDGAAVDLRWKRFGDMSAIEMQKESIQHKWGPMMGDPSKGWPAGLRLDVAKGQWFWYRDKAPAWATAAGDQLRLNQAILDYKAQVAAAAADAAAQAAQQKLDAAQADALAKQQAAEDAANQRQMDQEAAQATAQANIQAQQDAAAQQNAAAQAQTESQQYAAQVQAESAARIAEAQAEAQIQAQQDAADAAAMAAADAGGEPGAGAPDDQAAALAAVQEAGPTGMDDQAWTAQMADEVTGTARMSFRDRRDLLKDRG